MKSKYLIPSLLIPVALASCSNDELDYGHYEDQTGKELAEGLTLNVSFGDDALTRGGYVGSSESPFQHFVMQPDYTSAGALDLSDNTSLKGNMVGLAFVSEGSAVTNLPFYIAGYGSKKGSGQNDTKKIYAFAPQTSTATGYNKLYDLSITNGQTAVDKIYVIAAKETAKDEIEWNINNRIKKAKTNADLEVDTLDTRLAIMRSNFPIVAGKYFAYYPYDENFTTAGEIPVPGVPSILHTGAELSDSRIGAIDVCGLNNYLFGCSTSALDINGGTKSSDIKLMPVTGAMIFKIYNTSKTVAPQIKMITLQTKTGGAADFATKGTYYVGGTPKFTPTETTSMIGVSFSNTSIPVEGALGDDKYAEGTNNKWAVIPCYINHADETYLLKIHRADNKVATFEVEDPSGLGKAKHYAVDVNIPEADWKSEELFATNAEEFIGIVNTLSDAATIRLLDDIEIDDTNESYDGKTDGTYTLDKELTLVGDGKLTLSTTTLTISKPLTAANLVFNTNPILGNNKLNVTNLTVNSGKTVAFANADVITNLTNNGTVNATSAEITNVKNSGTFNVNYVADNKTVKVTTELKNNKSGVVNVNGSDANKKTTVLTVGLVSSQSGSTLNVGSASDAKAKLDATTINTAGVVYNTNGSVNTVAAVVNVYGSTSAATINDNSGTLNWNSAADMNLNVTNNGSFNLNTTCKFVGELDNKSAVTVASNATVSGEAGFIGNSANAGALITVNGTLLLTGTKLDIASGKLIDNGTLSGANMVTAPAGEMIKSVKTMQDIEDALGTVGMNQWYTGVSVDADINATPVTTTKKFYLNADLTFDESNATASSIGDVEVIGTDVTLTAAGLGLTAQSITINSGKKLTVGTASRLTVPGKITNNGTYAHGTGSVTVNCNGISGTGTWSNHPKF